jgi:biopolymer transport protein ExbB/TolQ
MIAWIIALILFVCLISVLVLQFKQLSAVRRRYEAVLQEVKSRGNLSDEALKEIERWKKRYEAEKAVKEEQVREAEKWKKRYWQKVHEDSDSYKTQIGKEEESWGDREPY